jgi:hypothetical protein
MTRTLEQRQRAEDEATKAATNGNGPQSSGANAEGQSQGPLERTPHAPKSDPADAMPDDVAQAYRHARTELGALSGCLAKLATARTEAEVREWAATLVVNAERVGLQWLDARQRARRCVTQIVG